MKIRTLPIVALSLILIGALFVGAVSALSTTVSVPTKTTLDNVRAYAPALDDNGLDFAVDGGELFVGVPGDWRTVKAPAHVIVNAVAVDPVRESVVYVGAANELAIYRSNDLGLNWQRIPLTDETVGGVTAIAVDAVQRLLYVGTDTAGLFRLRDVGSSMIVSSRLLLNEPVVQVVADASGSGLAFARTAWHLYRAEEYGLRWVEVNNLGSVATAVAIAAVDPVKVYVGTTDRGLLTSRDGLAWQTANEGLGLTPGNRLRIDALAVDPSQPNVLYVATSYLFGSTTIHETPMGIAMSADGAASWQALREADMPVVELLPVAGEPGSAFALTTQSRTPLAVGNAEAVVQANAQAAMAANSAETPVRTTGILAWLVAGLALLALLFAVGADLLRGLHRKGSSMESQGIRQPH